ncbi:MAG: cyclic nucleotide-binding domain-containing protein [Proteobacteria bacterium]|nr:cyclic nucleotide-binding domain-containing protein [Burkholderiales bacterium]
MSEPSGETTTPPSNTQAGAVGAGPKAVAAAAQNPPPPPSIERLGSGSGFVPLIEKVLRENLLLSQFNAEDLQRFASFLQIYRVSSGVPFIIEGDPGDFMVLVLEGFVEVFKKDTGGDRSLVGVAAPGKTLGEMSLIDGEPRFATCIAATAVTFAALPRKGLERIMKDQPQLGQKILFQLVLLLNQRLRHVSAQLLQVWQQQT